MTGDSELRDEYRRSLVHAASTAERFVAMYTYCDGPEAFEVRHAALELGRAVERYVKARAAYLDLESRYRTDGAGEALAASLVRRGGA